jgi:hypothetical protein
LDLGKTEEDECVDMGKERGWVNDGVVLLSFDEWPPLQKAPTIKSLMRILINNLTRDGCVTARLLCARLGQPVVIPKLGVVDC